MNKEIQQNITFIKELLNNPNLTESEKEVYQQRLKVLEELVAKS